MSGSERSGTLVILPGGLGDLVQLRDVLTATAQAVSGPVDLLTADSLVGLATSWGVFRAVVPLDVGTLYDGSLPARLALAFRLVRLLSSRRYASCLIFKAHRGFGGLAWAARIPRRVGFGRGSNPFLSRALPLDPDVHRVERARRLVALLLGRELPPPSAWTGRPGSKGSSGPRIGIAPGGARNAKGEMPERRWPVTRYVETAEVLAQRFAGARFFVFGAGADGEACASVAGALPRARVRNLCDALTLEGLEGALARLDLFLTHDNGLMHVGDRAGPPMVVVFGPTDPSVAAPRRDGVTCLWRPAGDLPCHDEVSGDMMCRSSDCCIRRVGVGEVVAAAEEHLVTRGWISR